MKHFHHGLFSGLLSSTFLSISVDFGKLGNNLRREIFKIAIDILYIIILYVL